MRSNAQIIAKVTKKTPTCTWMSLCASAEKLIARVERLELEIRSRLSKPAGWPGISQHYWPKFDVRLVSEYGCLGTFDVGNCWWAAFLLVVFIFPFHNSWGLGSAVCSQPD